MESINIVLTASITIISLGMFIVSFLSCRTYKNTKLGFVTSAFFVFFLKGLIQSLSLFTDTLKAVHPNMYLTMFDLGVLLLLFIATLKR